MLKIHLYPKIKEHNLYSAKLSNQLPTLTYPLIIITYIITMESLADTLYNHQLEANRLGTWQTLQTSINKTQRMTIFYISIRKQYCNSILHTLSLQLFIAKNRGRCHLLRTLNKCRIHLLIISGNATRLQTLYNMYS